ncbi:MAG: MBOAT family protein [Clostridia bacterium]|nr:MBOAT family protein [Clostridia bacterium]
MSVISLSFMAFTAVVFLGYFILPMKVRPYWLLLTSLYFYGCFGWDGFILLTLSVVTTFAAAHIVTKLKRNGAKKLVLTLTVILNAGILTAVKYLNYSLSLLGRIIELPVKEVSLIVSLGIAFYTMQAISYLVDVYRGKYPPARNFFKYFCYMTYFPIIMQGPISRYDQLADQLFTPHRFSFDRMKSGLSLTLWGLFKKMVIADRAALLVNEVFGNYTEYAGLEIVTAALMYTVQIYTDFSGCVDISRGISEVLGIKLIENFKHPYFATSIKDFWRRWHIALSSWFKDYIYIPLGGSRKGTFRKYLNLTVVFFVSGLWHGVGVHYIAWGLLQAFYQIVGELTSGIRNKFYDFCRVDRQSFSFKLGQQLTTFVLVNISWIFFRADGLTAAFRMLRSCFSFRVSFLNMGLDAKDWNVMIVSIAVLLIVSLMQERFSVREKLEKQNFIFRYAVYLAAVTVILIFGMYGPGYNASQFIYMQF